MITALAGIRITDIACGEHHYAALDANGDIYTWGNPSPQYNRGQMGHGDTRPVESPKRVAHLQN